MSFHPTSIPFDVRSFVSETLIDVFDTMLGLKAIPASTLPPGPVVDRVTGFVGLAGEGVCGAVYIHLAAPIARQATAAMLGRTVDELFDDSEIYDAVGELCNMVTGGLKSRLCDSGTSCALSTPSIIRGNSYEVRSHRDVRREVLLFTCNDEPITIEVHLKLN